MKRLIAYNAASPLFLQLHFHFVYHFSIEVFVASAFLWALLFLDVWFPCIKLSTIFFRFVYALQALVFLITKKKKKIFFRFVYDSSASCMQNTGGNIQLDFTFQKCLLSLFVDICQCWNCFIWILNHISEGFQEKWKNLLHFTQWLEA